MDLVHLVLETVDFFKECEEEISCEFNNFLTNNRSKLFDLSFDGTMAHLNVNFAKNKGIENNKDFRNFFIKKILEEFVFVNKKYFFDVTKLRNKMKSFEIQSLSKILTYKILLILFCPKIRNPFSEKIKLNRTTPKFATPILPKMKRTKPKNLSTKY